MAKAIRIPNVWFVEPKGKLTNRIVTDYLREQGLASVDSDASSTKCADGIGRNLISVPWSVVPLLWTNTDASFHIYSAKDSSEPPHHTPMFCCQRGKMCKTSKQGKIKRGSDLLGKPSRVIHNGVSTTEVYK